jgi:hypothetical protein
VLSIASETVAWEALVVREEARERGPQVPSTRSSAVARIIALILDESRPAGYLACSVFSGRRYGTLVED